MSASSRISSQASKQSKAYPGAAKGLSAIAPIVAIASTALLSIACSTLPDEEPLGKATSSASTSSSSYSFGSNGTNAGSGQDTYASSVSKAWQDILGRQPDQATRDSQISQLNAGTLTVTQLRSNLSISLEAANNIKNKFLQFFNRTAADSEVSAWQGYLASGAVTYANMDSAFINSSAFQGTVLSWARAAYQTILGRNPSQGEIDAMKNAISGGDSYSNQRRAVAFSGESQNRAGSLFALILQRGWNDGERDYWLTQLTNGLRLSDVEIQLLQNGAFSGIYSGTSTYVAQSYIQVFGRQVDGNGLGYYTGVINNGQLTYQGMRQTLAASEECGNAINAIYQSFLGRIANANELFQQRTFLNGGGSLISLREQLVASDVCRGTPSCAGGQ